MAGGGFRVQGCVRRARRANARGVRCGALRALTSHFFAFPEPMLRKKSSKDVPGSVWSPVPIDSSASAVGTHCSDQAPATRSIVGAWPRPTSLSISASMAVISRFDSPTLSKSSVSAVSSFGCCASADGAFCFLRAAMVTMRERQPSARVIETGCIGRTSAVAAPTASQARQIVAVIDGQGRGTMLNEVPARLSRECSMS